VSNLETGRHRAPSSRSPISSMSSTSTRSLPISASAISRSVQTLTRFSAVMVISAGTLASLALPAPASTTPAIFKRSAAVAVATGVMAPSAAQAPLVPGTFGRVGFVGVVKPAPVATPVISRSAEVVSRSSLRTSVSPESTPKQETPKQNVSKQKAPVAAPAPRGGGLLDIAASLAGIDYVYGGTTTDGFDCSGYTQYVFNKVGIDLPRTAEAQRQATTPVSDPQPGDLVFFGAPAHHVGIYAGNGKMWDSPETGSAVGLRTDRSERSGGATYGRVG
jgi:cell wall-associated NlpC family hydrolase